MSSPPHQSQSAYILSLSAIRAKCSQVFELAQADQLDYWTLDLSQESEIIDFACDIIKRDFGTDYNSIPPHDTLCHFGDATIDSLVDRWKKEKVGQLEIAKRMIDLTLVSVLLDSNTDSNWTAVSPRGENRVDKSEQTAVAIKELFEKGVFSGVEGKPCQVDGQYSLSSVLILHLKTCPYFRSRWTLQSRGFRSHLRKSSKSTAQSWRLSIIRFNKQLLYSRECIF